MRLGLTAVKSDLIRVLVCILSLIILPYSIIKYLRCLDITCNVW